MRSICIHGHFYQPPRENPWTGRIDVQPSAAPFPDWNHRINQECYQANAAAPIFAADGCVDARHNNYASISFNVGPTLMRWLFRYAPDVHAALVAADRHSLRRLGHGNALGQAYHHVILPLANHRDKVTEVRWGVQDFEVRFGRRPEAIWLAETAVDVETLEVLAAHGLRFVILAPGQARAVRDLDAEEWTDVTSETLDTSRPYRVSLPSGAEIAAFFYDGGPANGVAFGGWLNNGERMAAQLANGGSGLAHFATDGESYGHHHRHGEMALAYCIRSLRQRDDVSLTNYGAYLGAHHPSWQAQIQPVSAWSCAHGVGRWSENCGCVIDPRRAGQQAWRPVLRGALNGLRDQIDAYCVERLASLDEDLWDLRNRYVQVLLAEEFERSVPADLASRLARHRDIRRVLEVQRHRLMMFTSCGWFFDDPGGLETVQILRYAHRAIRMLESLGGPSLMESFRASLLPMRSSDPSCADGAAIYDQKVRAAEP